jgi:DNA-binding IclR family transcriptional regulator
LKNAEPDGRRICEPNVHYRQGQVIDESGSISAETASANTANVVPPPQYPIESVDNALRILLLMAERHELTLTETGRLLGVALSTAHRLMAALQYRRFVRQDTATKAYFPGPALTEVASAVLGRLDVRDRARPVLRRLNEELGETVHVATLDGDMVRFIDGIESPKGVRVSARTGRSAPAHYTATGHAMLADLPGEELRQLYPDENLPPESGLPPMRRGDLMAELAKVRRRGYALSWDENDDGVVAISISVPNTLGIRVALNCAIPASRMTRSQQGRVAAALEQVCAELSNLL